MPSKKKHSLVISSKLKFKKPSKHLSNINYIQPIFKQTVPQFGKFLIQAAKSGVVSKYQLEAVRVSLRRPIKTIKGSRVWVCLKPDRLVTKRSAETRMGRGKGSVHSQIALISKGQILFEIIGPTAVLMNSIYEKAKKKNLLFLLH